MGQVPAKICALILHLFCIYGKISPQQLQAKYSIVKDMAYLIEEPIYIILSTVEYLVEIGELEGHPFSPAQIVDLGFIIIFKHRIFRINVRKWMQRPIFEQM